ncbi:MAG: dihydrofolate reductase [Deltaproteobacteria bacterium]|nr:dihydrofolate reductase [Deltaproteobacteria bacterium]
MAHNGIIGVGGALPWHYPADLRRFKRLTLGKTVIMGRNTWASLPKKPLVDRRNIVITRRPLDELPRERAPTLVETYTSLADALGAATDDVWFIGGAQIYREAMPLANLIDVTYIPDDIADDPTAVYFPPIDDALWTAHPRAPHEDDDRLERQIFVRRDALAQRHPA